MKNSTKITPIDETLSGNRLDKVLSSIYPEFSRASIQKFIRDGMVTDNKNNILSNPSLILKNVLFLNVSFPEIKNKTLSGEDIPLDIVYEDKHLLVINKPFGLTVHPGAGITSGTLVHALINYLGHKNLASDAGEDRPGIVHRLDKDTSGLLLVAKDNETYHALKEDLAKRDIHRIYQAIVWGAPSPREGTIETKIARNLKNRLKMIVTADGKEAITHYRVIKPLGLHFSLVECTLDTGRTHQIRVHMAHIGHPVVGDPLYGLKQHAPFKRLSNEAVSAIKSFKRQALHAHTLAFTHPHSGKEMEFLSPLPDDTDNLIRILSL